MFQVKQAHGVDPGLVHHWAGLWWRRFQYPVNGLLGNFHDSSHFPAPTRTHPHAHASPMASVHKEGADTVVCMGLGH